MSYNGHPLISCDEKIFYQTIFVLINVFIEAIFCHWTLFSLVVFSDCCLQYGLVFFVRFCRKAFEVSFSVATVLISLFSHFLTK